MPALALKYRPTTFSDLVGQLHAAQALKNAITYGSIAQAYLFFGSRGVGKTSTARILAKCLNCVEGPTTEPCGKCDNCTEIAQGKNIDVIEMDAASNRGIEHIRNLRENARFAPMRSTYKIYIVDEVHMLTNEAFNALLKTLEEPPPHIVFIMATTEHHKIPETILSRCQSFAFKKFSNEEIISRLETILKNESLSWEKEALLPIAEKAEGSMRDSISLLDQVIAFSGENKIAHQTVVNILGIIPLDHYLDLLSSLRTRQLKTALLTLEEIHSQGYNLKNFLLNFLEFVKNTLMVQKEIIDTKSAVFTKSQFETVQQEASLWDASELVLAFERFYQLYNSWSLNLGSSSGENRVTLEIALVDLFEKLSLPSVSAMTRKLAMLEKAIESGESFQDQPSPGLQQNQAPEPAQAPLKTEPPPQEMAPSATPPGPKQPEPETPPPPGGSAAAPHPSTPADEPAPAKINPEERKPPANTPAATDDPGTLIQKEFGANEQSDPDDLQIFS